MQHSAIATLAALVAAPVLSLAVTVPTDLDSPLDVEIKAKTVADLLESCQRTQYVLHLKAVTSAKNQKLPPEYSAPESFPLNDMKAQAATSPAIAAMNKYIEDGCNCVMSRLVGGVQSAKTWRELSAAVDASATESEELNQWRSRGERDQPPPVASRIKACWESANPEKG